MSFSASCPASLKCPWGGHTQGRGQVCSTVHHPRLYMIAQNDLKEGRNEGMGQEHSRSRCDEEETTNWAQGPAEGTPPDVPLP